MCIALKCLSSFAYFMHRWLRKAITRTMAMALTLTFGHFSGNLFLNHCFKISIRLTPHYQKLTQNCV